MPEITTLFWDVGGVVLTNAWDHAERARAVTEFELDSADFEARHEKFVVPFETRQITLAEYLNHTVFHKPRPFSPSEFIECMYAQSKACPDALQLAAEYASSGRYLMATINNESLEMNSYRVRKFQLAEYFAVFCSSCYLGLRKPGAEIFTRALELTGREPAECVFIDDREENLQCPREMGIHAIHYESAAKLREVLKSYEDGN